MKPFQEIYFYTFRAVYDGGRKIDRRTREGKSDVRRFLEMESFRASEYPLGGSIRLIDYPIILKVETERVN